jgi:hypothetical protein
VSSLLHIQYISLCLLFVVKIVNVYHFSKILIVSCNSQVFDKMDRLSIFDQHDNGEATSGMVFGGGIRDIKKQLDPSFQTVDDVALVLPPGFEHMKVYLRIRPFTKSETHMFENQVNVNLF